MELVTGFFAIAGLVGVDWGARAQRRRDVVLGGLTGIVLAASWTAIMSLVVVAATVAEVSSESRWYHGIGDGTYVTSPDAPATRRGIEWYQASTRDPLRLSFRWAVFHGIGGIPAGIILILFGLAALAPACYSAWVYGQKLSTHWPRLGQAGWTWIGGAIAFFLGATSMPRLLEMVFIVMGNMFAPAVGAMAGDWLRQRGTGRGYVRAAIERGSSPGSRASGSGWHLRLGEWERVSTARS